MYSANLVSLALLLYIGDSIAAVAQSPQVPLLDTPSSCSKFSSYTALGDSYAGGYGSQSTLPECNSSQDPNKDGCSSTACGRDTGSYAYQFAHKYGVSNFQYLACNGNDSLEVLHKQVETSAFGQPNLVTVNVGGDDQSLFANTVVNCVVFYNDQKCQTAIENANKSITALRDGRLNELFNGIKKATERQDTRVVVLSYALFWGNVHELPGGNCTNHPSYLNRPNLGERTQMNVLATELNEALQLSAVRAGFSYVDVDTKYAGHRFCDAGEVWFQELAKSPSILSLFHPTLAGQGAYLAALEQVLGC